MPLTQDMTSAEKVTTFDEFNLSVPRDTFPAEGMAARAAQAVVTSFAWTDANPMVDLLANDIIDACKYLESHGGTATPPQLHGHDKSGPKC